MPHSQKKLKKFLEIIRSNDRIQQEFFEIEKTILQLNTFQDLITTLLKQLKTRFSLDYVGITFINGRFVKDIGLHAFLEKSGPTCTIVENTEQLRFQLEKSKPKLINNNLSQWSDFFPAHLLEPGGSLAVVPLRIGKSLIGTLNLFARSREKYNPNQATLFLERIATISSICINNVINHERLKHMSISDPLTSLANRRHFYALVEKELSRSRRYRHPFSLIYLDLNDFKRINDSYGHDIGDLCLKHISSILLQESRDTDCVARFGGDEFVIALCRSTLKEAKITRTRIEERIAHSPLVIGRKKIPLSASFGIASVNHTNTKTVDELLKIADKKLYSSKKSKSVVPPENPSESISMGTADL